MRIGAFMAEHMNDGFASLDEVADAIQRYNPHRPRPSDLGGSREEPAHGARRPLVLALGSRVHRRPLGGADETRSSLDRSRRG